MYTKATICDTSCEFFSNEYDEDKIRTYDLKVIFKISCSFTKMAQNEFMTFQL